MKRKFERGSPLHLKRREDSAVAPLARAEAPGSATRMTAKHFDFASSHFTRDGADRRPPTRDVGGTASTEDMGKAIAAAI